MSKSSTLLKAVSILLIIFGAISAVTGLLGVLGSAAITALGAGGLGAILIVVTIISCLIGIIEIIAGVKGVKGTNMASCKKWAVVILVISAIGLILSIIGSSFSWMTIGSLVLAILYFIGANQAQGA